MTFSRFSSTLESQENQLESHSKRHFLAASGALAITGIISSVQARASDVVWIRNNLRERERKFANDYRKERLKTYNKELYKIDAGQMSLTFDPSIKTYVHTLAKGFDISPVIASRLWFHESHGGKLLKSETGARWDFQLTSSVFDDMMMRITDNRGFARYAKFFQKLPLRAIHSIPQSDVKTAIHTLRADNIRIDQYMKALEVLRRNVTNSYANTTLGLVYYAALYSSAEEIPEEQICKQTFDIVTNLKGFIPTINDARKVFSAPELTKKDLTEGLNYEMKYFPESARTFTALRNYNGELARRDWYAAIIFA